MGEAASTWTAERVGTLRKLWEDGLSASQIAGCIGGITRNGVIGKLHRLGLMGANRPRPGIGSVAGSRTSQPVRQTALPTASVPSPRSVAVALSSSPTEPGATAVTIEGLKDGVCRWPIGDPSTPDFRFCGAESPSGQPYCRGHAEIAYVPAEARRRIR